jgi:hypothetical protein
LADLCLNYLFIRTSSETDAGLYWHIDRGSVPTLEGEGGGGGGPGRVDMAGTGVVFFFKIFLDK